MRRQRWIRARRGAPLRGTAQRWIGVSVVVATGLALGVNTAPAFAAYGPGAEPASALGDALSDDTSAGPLISGDGRYVVFQTASAVLLGQPANPDERYASGIVRKDLVTGDVALVAPPKRVLRSDGTPVEGGGGTTAPPSGISRDGRYVLFGTTASLSADDPSGQSPDVYVRDMQRPLSGSSSYELVSAQDGSTSGADYGDLTVGSTPGLTGYALSADGRRAVFVTTGTSNLPSRNDTTTPPRQVWLRDLDARTTRLISRTKDDPSDAGSPAEVPTAAAVAPPAVAISADGESVVWTAGEAQRQTPTLSGEGSLGDRPTLLWRDLHAPTSLARRVAGAADLDDPACSSSTVFVPSTTATGPCYGPFVGSEGIDQNGAGSQLALRGISGDGRRVLFTSSAAMRPFDPLAFRASSMYLADMAPGLPRKRGVTLAWSFPNLSGRYSIDGGWLATDGRHAVFSSRDTRFDGLQPVGAFPTGELITFNVYAADLDAHTVERVTVGYDGSDYSTGTGVLPVNALSASDDASSVAFAAADGNLFLGDANGVPDILVASRARATGGGHGGRVLPLPAPLPPVDAPPIRPLPSRYVVTLGPVQVSKRTGTASVRVSLPAAGTIVGTASGTAKRTTRRHGRKRVTTTVVAVGRARTTVKGASTVTVRIPVGAKARTLLRRTTTPLAVRLSLRFAPASAAPTTTTRSYRLLRAYVTPAKRKTEKRKRSAARATPTGAQR